MPSFYCLSPLWFDTVRWKILQTNHEICDHSDIPFLRPNPLTPNSDGARSAQSAPSPACGPKSPIRPPQRSNTAPIPAQESPKPSDPDYALPPFPPRSNTIAESGMRSRAKVRVDEIAFQKPLPPDPEVPSVFDPTSVDDNVERPVSPILPPTVERTDFDSEQVTTRKPNRHRREASIDSKMLYRLSMATAKFGNPSSGSISISPGMKTFGHGNVVEEVPPLPTTSVQSSSPTVDGFTSDPDHFESKDEFDQARSFSTSPGKNKVKSGRRTGVYGSFDFGLPQHPKMPWDDNEENDISGSGDRLSTISRLEGRKPTTPEPHQKQLEPPLPDYRLDEDFSVSSFARGLGISAPYHATNLSATSSVTAPSESVSGSSFSSPPSSSGHRQRSDTDLTSTDDTNSSFYDSPQPPRWKPEVLDSPTDPAFKNGRLSPLPNDHQSETSHSTNSSPFIQQDSNSFKSHSHTDSQYSQSHSHSYSHSHSHSQSQSQSQSQPKSFHSRTPTATNKGRCRACQNFITGKSVSSADGRLTGRYHKACFVCRTCREPFQTADFYVFQDQPYCGYHYHEQNGSLCCACDSGIEGQYLQTEEPRRDRIGGCQKFHPDCFKCSTCRVVLRGDYLEFEGRVYCERDGRRAASTLAPPPLPPSPMKMRMMVPPGGPPPHRRPSPYGGSASPLPPLPPSPGFPMGPRFPSGNPNRLGPASGGGGSLGVPGMPGRRFPERRTTRLMMA